MLSPFYVAGFSETNITESLSEPLSEPSFVALSAVLREGGLGEGKRRKGHLFPGSRCGRRIICQLMPHILPLLYVTVATLTTLTQ